MEPLKIIDLLIIGAHKAGTTSLKEYLGQHPQVCTHEQLEMGYFENDPVYEQGYPSTFERFFNNEDCRAEEIRRIFAKNVSVMYSQTALERIKRHNPEMHLVAVLRNPIDRAYSAYWYARRLGWETIENFETAIEAKPNRFGDDDLKNGTCDYLGRGKYAEYLEPVIDKFNPEFVHIYLLEDLKKDASGLCQSIIRIFPDLDEFQFDLTRRFNASALPKNTFMAKILSSPREARRLKDLLRKFVPAQVRDAYRTRLIDLNEYEFSPPKMDDSVRKHLQEFYAPYNSSLSALIGRDLDEWGN